LLLMPTEARIKLSELPDRYFFLDPAANKKNQKLRRIRANSAITGVAPDWLNRVHVIYSWADRVSADKLIELVIDICEKYKPRLFGVEANAMQSLFAELVHRDAVKRLKRSVPIVPIHQPTNVDKDWRIRTTLQPVIGEGRLFLNRQYDKLIAEIVAFPMSPIKDRIDSLASAVTITPLRALPERKSQEAQALAEYLRESGAPASYIEETLAKEYNREADGPMTFRNRYLGNASNERT